MESGVLTQRIGRCGEIEVTRMIPLDFIEYWRVIPLDFIEF